MDAKQFLAEFGHIANAPGGVARLRELILHLAVSGRLTAQLDTENALEFLTEIQLRREALGKQGEIRTNRKIRNEQFISPWQIPPNWLWCRFGELCSFSAGRTPSRKENKYWNTGDYPWFSIADLQHGKIVSTTSETLSEVARVEVFKSAPIPAGSLLMSFKLTIGKLCILGIDAYHNEAIITIEPFADALKEFFFKCLNGFDLSADNKAAIKGNTLNQDSISNILIALPPKEEILRIVAKVDELMALCDKLETQQQQRRSLQNNLRQSTLQAVAASTCPQELQANWTRFADNFGQLFSTPKDVAGLREVIYQLAVTGCLISQDPVEGDACDLLAEVSRTREQLILEKRFKRALKLESEQLAIPSIDLPSTWRWSRLLNLGEINPRNCAKDDESATFIPMSGVSERYNAPPERYDSPVEQDQ